ncbi:MAG: magnesium transporter [Gammaproteobacteria bacterium AqS3]|nr:magnesium transporter [Gammaproteobacteria bacterium AqS3]
MAGQFAEKLPQAGEELLEKITGANPSMLRSLMSSLSSGELAQLLEQSLPAQRAVLWNLLDEDAAAEVLHSLNTEVSSEILHDLQPDQIAFLLSSTSDDDLADILQSLPKTLTQAVLNQMDEHDRSRSERALSYDANTAGGLMTTELITVGPDHLLKTVADQARRHIATLPENLDSLLVVGRDNQLLGSLPLIKLALLDPSLTVREVMETDSLTPLPHTLSSAEVAERFQLNHWVSAPVIDEDGHLVGRITVDDIVELVRDQAESALLNMASVKDHEDTFAPTLKVMRLRAFWLGINLLTALLGSSVIKLFEETIAQVIALAVLTPLIASMAGVAGIQTSTIVVRALSLNQLNRQNRWWLLRREFYVGFGNGLIWAVVMAVLASAWFNDTTIGAVIALSILISLSCAKSIGVLLPLALKRLGSDPALSTGVILTTFTDVIGFLSFLGLAAWFYG